MGSVPHPDLNEIPRVALYARVSTEDQAERQTVQGQLDFLRIWHGAARSANRWAPLAG
jgi:predicted site-specific integrase-resolvase